MAGAALFRAALAVLLVPMAAALAAPAILAAGGPGISSAAAQEIPAAARNDVPTSPDFQQGIEYRIEARLDETTDVLQGRARIRYRNESSRAMDDFYLHLYLNAFRPNSLWARTDLAAGITTFQDLGPEDHAFERIGALTAGGRAVELRYPYAPDSTIVAFDLPETLDPGETVVVEYRWEARLSTVPRRQGRRGRQHDFAQWYPRVVVYDDEGWRPHPLYRQGEFYGEFATYDVVLDVAEDQVMAATGVPVEGDPGWRRAAVSGTGEIDHRREWYGSPGDLPRYEPLGLLGDAPEGGRKRVRWRAEDVHHFAWSTSPDYIYETGRWNDVAIHVLYRPGDESTWGGGVAVERTAVALEWLDRIFGDYLYPQVTNLHRIEGGGTEFPMLIMDGSASQGLILHEVGHIYAHGILANNEWYEGWLDEGLSSFQTDWFFEKATGEDVFYGDRVAVVLRDLLGTSEPVVLPAEDYSDSGTYGSMIYGKGSVVFYMLRELAGEDAFLEILRTYYQRHQLRHVDSDDLKSVAEDVLGTDLDWFFGQWLHTTGVVDYALQDVEVAREDDGWRTRLTLERRGDILMPVPVRLTGASGAVHDVRLEGTRVRGRYLVRTPFQPVRIELDPDGAILDWNVANNAWGGSFLGNLVAETRLDHPLRPVPTAWRSIPLQVFPLLWSNDAGGWVGGVQARTAKLGVADRGVLRLGLPGVEAGDKGSLGDGTDLGSAYLRLENPVLGRLPDFGTSFEGFAGEGRAFAGVSVTRSGREGPHAFAPVAGSLDGRALRALPRGSELVRAWGTAWGVYDDAYFVPGRWSAGTRLGVELGLGAAATLDSDALPVAADLAVTAGFDSQDRRWLRGLLTVAGEREIPGDWSLRGRALAGAVLAKVPGSSWSGDEAPRERMFFLGGGDPFQAVSNPWVRSGGAPLVEHGYVPGGGGLRGFHPGAAVPALGALGLELVAPPLEVDLGGTWALRPLAFAGAAADLRGTDEGTIPSGAGGDAGFREDLELERRHLYHVAGVGLEIGPAGSPLRLRLDVPFLVSDPELAATGRDGRAAWRWTVSVGG